MCDNPFDKALKIKYTRVEVNKNIIGTYDVYYDVSYLSEQIVLDQLMSQIRSLIN